MDKRRLDPMWKKKSKDKKAYMRQYGIDNREAINARTKSHRLLNSEKVKQVRRDYESKSREKIRVRVRAKYKNDITFKLATNLRSRVRVVLLGKSKSSATLVLLGCSVPNLKEYLENQFQIGMNWENYGPVWHVDHKRPCSSFDLSDPAQQRQCFHFSNLQPLFAFDNLSKGAKYG